MQSGTLHLIPNFLDVNSPHTIPAYLVQVVTDIKIWYVEEIRSARRYLKAMNRDIIIDNLNFHILNEHENASLKFAATFLQEGKDIGMISESGCPAVADPGSALVQIAHEINATVKPHTGPNSILLALMGSGFNGQHYQFNGYLPNKQPMLTQKILDLEKESKLRNVSQFFIETPYRNDQMIREILKTCQPETRFCVAANLTTPNERILSLSIKKWKTVTESFHKKPAVFGLYCSD